MEIERVDLLALRHRLREPLGYSQRWESSRTALLVKLTASGGLVGWGECSGSPELAAAAINDFLGPRVVGQDPLKSTLIWENLYHRSRELGRHGVMMSALSGIDLALWDIKGKAYGVPVSTLLGGARTDQVEGYASGLYFTRSGAELPQRLAAAAVEAADQGYRAVKLKVGLGLDSDLENIDAVRQALGPEAKLAIDADCAFSAREAAELGRQAAAHRLWWFEEPVAPEDYTGCAEVRQALAHLGVPIAGGQTEATRFGFAELCQRRCVDYLQPHLGAAGGFTAGLQIATIASIHGLELRPQASGSAVAMAATLHYLAALPDTPGCLAARSRWIECDETASPLRDGLAPGFPERDGATIRVPSGPGLGLEIDESRCEAFR